MIPVIQMRRNRAPEKARSRMASRLSRMLKRQVDALEGEPEAGYSENRVKALLLLAKAIQAMEVVEQKNEKAIDAESAESEDILEFRRRLERQIQALDVEGQAQRIP